MASAELLEELNCSICLNIYSDPIILSCGHNFCRACIGSVLDSQEGSGVYSCPECRAEYQQRPALQRNLKLCKIAEHFHSIYPEQDSGIVCTYCVYTPVPAVKTCLHCEASLCETHLRAHIKSDLHVLSEPTKCLEDKKCSIHKRFLEYYCSEDGACICVSCRLDGTHRGHQVETLCKASEEKKQKLTQLLGNLTSKREETGKRVQRLQEQRKEVQDKAAGVMKNMRALFKELHNELEFLEKRIMIEISWQSVQISLRASHLISQLEVQKEELSKKMGHIEEMCTLTDPFTFLQRREDGDSEAANGDDSVSELGDLDEGQISATLHSGLTDILTGATMNSGISGQRFSNISHSRITGSEPVLRDFKISRRHF
ncbi:E3 ubiquitin/ISG15 ligase TRIM25-like [Pelobates fuscus]|uniref:E3 ubiquitin/ISG15 ligase TRIM25-like n=1 Tax=Pelobates fuscus TaxID=191477 RepID=UPI002FE44AC6